MKQRILILHIAFFIIHLTNGQTLPSDSLILKIIYKKVDKGGLTTTVDYPNPEFKMNKDDSLTFKVVFKNFIFINNTKKLYVETRANSFYSQGHQFGFTDTYYLDRINNTWRINKSIKGEEPNPIGDSEEMNIVNVGKYKSAIISTFSSTGNHHLERNISISLITDSGLKGIGDIDLDYSNEAWVDKDDIQNIENCRIESYESDYKIEESQSEWFKITVTRKTKLYSKRCTNEEIKAEVLTYFFDGNRYTKMNK